MCLMKQKIILIIICILNAYNVCSQTIQELKRQAETNDPAALWNVGCAYFNGTNGVSVNYSEALKWYTLAANGGDVNAMGQTAYMYYTGKGTEENHSMAFAWWKKAADSGDTKAYTALGAAYGYQKKYSESNKYFKMAYEKGDKYAASQLGWNYYAGKGVKQNYEEAYKYFKYLADNNMPDGYNGLSYLYMYGLGVNKDLDKAMAMIDKAIEISNNSPRYLDSKGELYAIMGDQENAKKLYNEIIKTNPTYYENVQTTLTKYIKGETTSDVDESIPTTSDKDNDYFAVVISNENYMRESKVPFAINDGRTFTEYCNKTLGIPTSNIHFVTNATYNNIRYEINWLRNVIKAYNGKAKVIFYYAGHGIPDEQNKNAYLLPVDGYGTDIVTGYALSNLYKELSELPSQSVTIFLDACFSGTKREGDMLSSARGVAIKVKQTEPTGNLVVFSAAQGDETAYPYKEKGHGMFTYYLLKKLQETKGNVTLEQLGDYIKDEVSKKSIVINGKPQTPTIIPAKSISTNWINWTLK